MDKILIVDCGGTNVRFACVEGDEKNHTITKERVFKYSNYPSFIDACEGYLNEFSLKPIKAVMAFACPIKKDNIKLTNNSWSFKKQELIQRLGIDVIYLNDLEAVAWSLLDKEKLDLVPVYCDEKPTSVDEPAVVIAPGTGLGVGALFPKHPCVISGEGGHVTLAATTAYEEEIIRYLRQKFGHVSAERCLSGQGLINLYNAVRALRGEDVEPLVTPIDVSAKAGYGCQDGLRTFELFSSFLGNVAGNFAVTFGSFSGIYLGGGVLQNNISLFNKQAFRDNFEAKGRFKDYLSQIPSFLMRHPFPGFLGLQSYIGNHPRIWK